MNLRSLSSYLGDCQLSVFRSKNKFLGNQKIHKNTSAFEAAEGVICAQSGKHLQDE